MEIYQISVFLENRAGKLSEVTNILAENNIDLRAISIAETSEKDCTCTLLSDRKSYIYADLSVFRIHT